MRAINTAANHGRSDVSPPNMRLTADGKANNHCSTSGERHLQPLFDSYGAQTAILVRSFALAPGYKLYPDSHNPRKNPAAEYSLVSCKEFCRICTVPQTGSKPGIVSWLYIYNFLKKN